MTSWSNTNNSETDVTEEQDNIPEGYEIAPSALVDRLFEDVQSIEDWIRNEERVLVNLELRCAALSGYPHGLFWDCGCGCAWFCRVLMGVRSRRSLLNAILKKHLELCGDFRRRDATENLMLILEIRHHQDVYHRSTRINLICYPLE